MQWNTFVASDSWFHTSIPQYNGLVALASWPPTTQVSLDTMEHLRHQSDAFTQHMCTSIQWNTCGISQLASHNTGVPQCSGTLVASVSCLYTAQVYLNTVEHLWHQSAAFTQHRCTSIQWNTCGISQLASHNTGVLQYSGTLVASVSWPHTTLAYLDGSTQVYLNTVEHLWCQSAGLTQHKCTSVQWNTCGVNQLASHNTGVPWWFYTTQVYLNTVEHLWCLSAGLIQHRCTSMASHNTGVPWWLHTTQVYFNGLTQHRCTSIQWNTCGVSQLASHNTGVPQWLHTTQVYLNGFT